MLPTTNFFAYQKSRGVSEGVKIVRDILKSNPFPNGFTTLQLFQVAIQHPPPPEFLTYRHSALPPKILVKPSKDRYRKDKPIRPWAPSHPEHPIRSVRFLKTEVLPQLAEASEIIKVRQKRLTPLDGTEKVIKGRDPAFEFVWKVVDPNEVPPPPRSRPKKEVVVEEAGVDLANEHLNKSRQHGNSAIVERLEKLIKDRPMYPSTKQR